MCSPSPPTPLMFLRSVARPLHKKVPRAAASRMSAESSWALSPQARYKAISAFALLTPSRPPIFVPNMRARPAAHWTFSSPRRSQPPSLTSHLKSPLSNRSSPRNCPKKNKPATMQRTGRSMPVVHLLWEQADRVQFSAARQI